MFLPPVKLSCSTPVMALILALSLAACSFRPYRLDIQQGNVVTVEQFAQLKVGMTPEQVRFLLGTPLLNDVFHANRWDYYYRMVKGTTREVTAYALTVHFSGGKVERIDADEAFRSQKPEEGNGNRVYDLSGPAKS
jgi:outer membrane protein assembly factor BamE